MLMFSVQNVCKPGCLTALELRNSCTSVSCEVTCRLAPPNPVLQQLCHLSRPSCWTALWPVSFRPSVWLRSAEASPWPGGLPANSTVHALDHMRQPLCGLLCASHLQQGPHEPNPVAGTMLDRLCVENSGIGQLC